MLTSDLLPQREYVYNKPIIVKGADGLVTGTGPTVDHRITQYPDPNPLKHPAVTDPFDTSLYAHTVLSPACLHRTTLSTPTRTTTH